MDDGDALFNWVEWYRSWFTSECGRLVSLFLELVQVDVDKVARGIFGAILLVLLNTLLWGQKHTMHHSPFPDN